jgi:uncharacterized protein YbbC (DUF1343 family)
LCNQTAWHEETGEYLFETLYRKGNLRRVFTPEHGLFGELQDQAKLDSQELYAELMYTDCEFVSLYGIGEASLSPNPAKLQDLDALIIDLQDVGVRYYTYLSTIRNLFISLKKENIPLQVWVIDRENPAGPSVEGSPLLEEYASFIGIAGLPQRHGLTIGEMARYFHAEAGADFPLHVVSKYAEPNRYPWIIPLSPNMPGFFTSGFYSGQCLWEGTNVSEGRGTTRPFEVFGAPWMETLMGYNKKASYTGWNDPRHPLFDPCVALRWHRFIPTFHKYKEESCFGFQLIRLEREGNYHALLHGLRLVRFVKENCENFVFRPRNYEAGNDKTAIELFAGDPLVLNYLKGETEIEELKEHFKKNEAAWIEKVREYRLYEEPLESASA